MEAERPTLGDVVLLTAGDGLPADGRLASADALEVDESALTAESLAVDKRAEPPIPAAPPLAERATMAYAGSTVTRGSGRLLVTAVAAGTEVGRIAGSARSWRRAPRSNSAWTASRHSSCAAHCWSAPR